MKYLSLFSGVGGGDLACQHLLGWRCMGYVEFNDYCQRVIAARIRDRMLDSAPIYGDVRTFISDGYAESYKGMVDVIAGGFPCQPFSNAGKRRGADDPRNMWPATIECIRTIRPQFAFLENVAALLSSGYFGTILGDLAESGYDARWRILSAAELGAPHQRDRIWIVCNASSQGNNRNNTSKSKRVRLDMEQDSLHQARGHQIKHNAHIPNPLLRENRGVEVWNSEPAIQRMVDGMAYGLDRTHAIGNGQVSAVAAKAWDLLTSEKRP